jgi:amino-acid N-acetyltransferase
MNTSVRPADLRGILEYSSRFLGRLFVLNIDSEVIIHDNFRNLTMDISVLRSLGIRICIVHGASREARRLAEMLGKSLSNDTGMGVTDQTTLRISCLAAARLSHEILQGLSEMDLRGAVTNAIIAHPSGILSGVDQQWTGRVERIDKSFLEALLERDAIPVIPPHGFDGEGRTFRVNSDDIARAVAVTLRADKLIFIASTNGAPGAGTLAAQFSVDEAARWLKRNTSTLDCELASKMEQGLQACQSGVNRAHIIDGTKDDALLNEVFSTEGIGTMIYGNDYESIRPARKKDARVILRMTRKSVASEELLPRKETEIRNAIDDFYIFEIDGSVVGCVQLQLLDAQQRVWEMGCLLVSEGFENQGIGLRLMKFIENRAREHGCKRLLALSTRAFNYFKSKGGFEEGDTSLLPDARRAAYEASGRKSKVMFKNLG